VGAGEAREEAARLVDLAIHVEVRQPVLQVYSLGRQHGYFGSMPNNSGDDRQPYEEELDLGRRVHLPKLTPTPPSLALSTAVYEVLRLSLLRRPHPSADTPYIEPSK
jgi:hypothetical protein